MKIQDAPIPSALPAVPGAVPPATAPRSRPEATLLQVFTLVLWLTCLAVGWLGLFVQAHRAAPKPAAQPTTEPPPMKAELIDVELTPAPVLLTSAEPAPTPEATPSPPDVPPAAPALPEVAAPSPMIAFAVPVKGPARIVPAARAAPAAPAPKPPRPAVEQLVYGQGTAAAQPKPEYPSEALAARQEGVVGIAFTVAPGGRVSEARVAEPCPWPSLNQAALSVVRDEWSNPRWVPGHTYLVRLRFHINQL